MQGGCVDSGPRLSVRLLGKVRASTLPMPLAVDHYGVLFHRAKLGPGGLDRGRRSYLGNLLLKINAKLGGVNVAIEGATWLPEPFKNKLVSIVGIDVNHNSEEQPSVAALVASVDHGATQYVCEPLMQAGGQRREIIDRMKPAMKNILMR